MLRRFSDLTLSACMTASGLLLVGDVDWVLFSIGAEYCLPDDTCKKLQIKLTIIIPERHTKNGSFQFQVTQSSCDVLCVDIEVYLTG